MNKGNKVALRHAANAIEGIRPQGGVTLGARASGMAVSLFNTTDKKRRPFASVYLAQRAGLTPNNQRQAQVQVAEVFGLSPQQVQKLDQVAASTHNLKQRSQRVASYIRNVVTKPGYLGRGAVTVIAPFTGSEPGIMKAPNVTNPSVTA